MLPTSNSGRRPRARSRVISTIGVALAIAVVEFAPPGVATVVAQAQQSDPCGLLTTDEIRALVPQENTQVSQGVATAVPAGDFATCRYTWGVGTQRRNLAVSVFDAARAYAGMNPDAIKQRFGAAITVDTADEAIGDVGEAALFKAHSPLFVSAGAYLKNRLLNVSLDGIDAVDQKAHLISLLKAAASRL